MKMHVLKYKKSNNYIFTLANNEVVCARLPLLTDINKLFTFNLCPWWWLPPTGEFKGIGNFISYNNAKIIATLDVDADVSDRIIVNPKESLLKLKELIPEEFV